MYRVFQYLSPLSTAKLGIGTYQNYIFQETISIPDYHASFQNYSAIYLLQVYVSRSSTTYKILTRSNQSVSLNLLTRVSKFTVANVRGCQGRHSDDGLVTF